MLPAADASLARIAAALNALGRPVRLMEVCGTHTHAIGKGGLRSVLPGGIELVSGPGCPVCVTDQSDIERMLWLARQDLSVATFGDMIRVPGHEGSLETVRSQGADVRIVYSPLDALRMAKEEPEREVVFLAVGFETTAPGVAAVVERAVQQGVANFSIYPCHKLILPAMEAVAASSHLDGFITPGHVTAIVGPEHYGALAEEYAMPCVATGFEPLDVLEGTADLVEHIVRGESTSTVQYKRIVKSGGNPKAWGMVQRVFAPCDAPWRGLGTIPGSGLALRDAFAACDAIVRHHVPEIEAKPLPGCRCGDVLRGTIQPRECPLFGERCTPRRPLGPCMVSSEGACAARYKYG